MRKPKHKQVTEVAYFLLPRSLYLPACTVELCGDCVCAVRKGWLYCTVDDSHACSYVSCVCVCVCFVCVHVLVQAVVRVFVVLKARATVIEVVNFYDPPACAA